MLAPMGPVATAVLPPLAAGYGERVRFAWERDLRRQLQQMDLRPEASPSGWDESRLGVVQLTPALAPRPHRLAREVAATLRMTAPFDLFQTRNFVQINAQAISSRTPPAVGLIGPVVNLMNDGELRVVLGHELGHILAHSADSRGIHLASAYRLGSRARLLAARCCVAAEITADRFGLLAAQDLQAAVGVEIASETGLDPRALEADMSAYLATCIERVERGEGSIAGDTHPTRDFRLFAASLFSRSDVFRDLTGRGTGELSLGDVDEQLRQRLMEAPLVAPARPGPVVTRHAVPVATGFELAVQVEGFSVAHDVELPDLIKSPWAARAVKTWAGARKAERADASTAEEVPSPPSSNAGGPAVDDDLERRFLELERAAEHTRGGRPKESEGVAPGGDLETRFRELEERFGKK